MHNLTSLAAQGTPSVLVADDDPIFRHLVVSRLVKLCGRAVEAEDGSAAWDLLLGQTFDLAIVDLNMPNLNGIELIGCMRGHPRTRHMPIIVITSQDEPQIIEEALLAGATSFLTKPVNWSTFEHHLSFLLRMATTERRARTSMQLAAAVLRGQEAVISKFSRTVKFESRDLMARIASGPSPAGSRPDGGEIRSRLAALATQADHVLQLAKLLSTGVSVADEPVALESMLSGIVDCLKSVADARGVVVELERVPEPISVRCDPSSLQLAVAELMQNAISHAPPRTKVTISTQIFEDGLLAISVTDHGRGMQPEFIAAVLSHTGAELGDSEAPVMGSGLALAKSVADAHGGSLEFRTMPGQGTTALLLLPPDRTAQSRKTAGKQ